VRFASLERTPTAVMPHQKAKAKQILWDWLEADGFQEGADGASDVIAAVFGDSTAKAWIDEFYLRERQKGMERAGV
jgi:hypothetical protein